MGWLARLLGRGGKQDEDREHRAHGTRRGRRAAVVTGEQSAPDPAESEQAEIDPTDSEQTELEQPDEIPPVVEVEIGPVIDLHTFPPSETRAIVEAYLEEVVFQGLTEVRIIHGRGEGVQREIVRSVLDANPLVASFADAEPARGGWGATVAFLHGLEDGVNGVSEAGDSSPPSADHRSPA